MAFVNHAGKQFCGQKNKWKGGEVGMNFTEEEVYAIFAFIRNHEKEDIPEDIWNISERIYEWMYENS